MNALRAIIILASVFPASAQYAGPAILSRGDVPTGMKQAQVDFRPFASIQGSYDTGLSAVAVDNEGNLANAASAGLVASWGVSGIHSWRRTSLGLNYAGSVRHYFRQTNNDGINQSFGMGLTRQLSRRVIFSLNQLAGTLSRNFGIAPLQQTVPFDPATTYLPVTDFFDNRTTYFNSQGALTYQHTARLSFRAAGGYFTVHRRATSLYDTTGETAQGDVQYRLSRNTTIGVDYTFSHFAFSKAYGGSDIHITAATYARRLTKSVEMSVYAGVAQVKTSFIENVPLDPVIAAILGQAFGAANGYRTDYSPNVGARLSKTVHNGVFSASASRDIIPGNGLFLTSITTRVAGGYSYTGLRYWSFSIHGGYNNSKVISNLAGHYGGYSGTLSMSRRIAASVHIVTNVSARRYQSQEFNGYNRNIYQATLGLSFAPGDIPLRIW